MNELNISAVDATAMETAATASAPKHKWLSKLTRGAKVLHNRRRYGIYLCNSGICSRHGCC